MKSIAIILGFLIGTVIVQSYQIHKLVGKVTKLETMQYTNYQVDSVQNLIIIEYLKP